MSEHAWQTMIDCAVGTRRTAWIAMRYAALTCEAGVFWLKCKVLGR